MIAEDMHLPRVVTDGYQCSCGFKVAGVKWTAAQSRMWEHIRDIAANQAITSRSLLAEVAELREMKARGDALAREWTIASGLDPEFTFADLKKASPAQRTLWEAADDLRAALAPARAERAARTTVDDQCKP